MSVRFRVQGIRVGDGELPRGAELPNILGFRFGLKVEGFALEAPQSLAFCRLRPMKKGGFARLLLSDAKLETLGRGKTLDPRP